MWCSRRPSGLCDAIFRATPLIARRRAGDRRPARHGLVPGGRRSRRLPDDELSFLLFPVEQPEFFDAVVLDDDGPGARDPGQAAGRRLALDLGRVQDAGPRAARAARACGASATAPDEYIGTLVNAYLAGGGEAVGVKAGDAYVDVGTLHGYRAAIALARATRREQEGAAGARVALGWPGGARASTDCTPRAGSDAMNAIATLSQGRDPAPRRGARAVVPQHRCSTASATAPDHFLGDYPAVKWQQLRRRDPAGSHRQERARYRLQRRLLLDRDEAARRRARARRSTSTTTTWRRRASPPRSPGSTSSSASSRSTTSARSGERFDVVLFMGVLYHLRHPLLALDLIHEHVASDLLVFQSMQRGIEGRRAGRRRTTRSGRPSISTSRATRSCTSSSTATPTIRPTGGCRTAPASRRCCAAPASRSLQHPEDEVYVCRRVERAGMAPARSIRREGAARMIEAAMIWNEPNNKSHWDPEIDPGWSLLRRDGDRRRAGDPGREPDAAARARRHVADRSRPSSATWRSKRRARPCRRRRRARLPARLEPLADPRMAGEARRDPRRHRPADLGHRGRRLDLRRRGGAGLGPEAHGRASRSARRRASTGTASTTCRAPGRRRPATARPRAPPITGISTWACCARTARRSRAAEDFAKLHAGAGHLPVVPLRGPPARRRRRLDEAARRHAICAPACPGPTASARTRSTGSTARWRRSPIST